MDYMASVFFSGAKHTTRKETDGQYKNGAENFKLLNRILEEYNWRNMHVEYVNYFQRNIWSESSRRAVHNNSFIAADH